MSKRLFDLAVSLPALALLSPLLLGIAAAIKLDSPGPVFFRQERVGLHGRPFRIHKFRTMVADAERSGPQLTRAGDPRVTRVGAFLRRHKLDELAQLIDVVRGDMSIVGPRPEVPRYVALYPQDVRGVVLSVRPGITDAASVEYKDESAQLAAAADPEQLYVSVIMPQKLKLCVHYVRNRSLAGDLAIVARTLAALLRP
ncbi:MAG: sugar transferase [Gammaproteobacteria bacterium]|nr:sugar transferase [Gammaproteobacteria bacterium]